MNRIHFIGIGGIGMSALAAFCRHHGMEVTGSDRGADKPENARIINALKNSGIKIFAQDGSYIREGRPDALIWSSAIEEDNPDLAAAPDVPRMHRAELLDWVLRNFKFKTSIAITGSCGKSTVTAQLTETLYHLGCDPAMLNGALSKRFANPGLAGNFRPGRSDFLVFEADESDKSLLKYSPDYAVILNMGTDHYDRAELIRVFGKFLRRVKRGAVLSREVYDALKPEIAPDLPVTVFETAPGATGEWAVSAYDPKSRRAQFHGLDLRLPQPGRHCALNTMVAAAMLAMLGVDGGDRLAAALESFAGVWRRNDFAGLTASGAAVYDDYAHNPEKILSCLKAMRESADGRLFAVFQPHGFRPFGFMADQLFEYLEDFLRPGDRFWLLPVFYAGGTASFTPTSKEVAKKWLEHSAAPERYRALDDREELRKLLAGELRSGDIVVIMGARDNSLSQLALSLADANK